MACTSFHGYVQLTTVSQDWIPRHSGAAYGRARVPGLDIGAETWERREGKNPGTLCRPSA